MFYFNLFIARTSFLGVRVSSEADTFVDGQDAFLVCNGRSSFIPEDFIHLFQREPFRLWNLFKEWNQDS